MLGQWVRGTFSDPPTLVLAVTVMTGTYLGVSAFPLASLALLGPIFLFSLLVLLLAEKRSRSR